MEPSLCAKRPWFTHARAVYSAGLLLMAVALISDPAFHARPWTSPLEVPLLLASLALCVYAPVISPRPMRQRIALLLGGVAAYGLCFLTVSLALLSLCGLPGKS